MEPKVIWQGAALPKPAGLRLLSLDGGGVRGLSTLFVLKYIMDRLNKERGKSALPPVKPCDIFDLVGGTNIGG
jgi:patatin-like phospholipase/acyl hydrolase